MNSNTSNQLIPGIIDQFIHEKMQKYQIPGLSLAVLRDGKIIHSQGYGLAHIEQNIPVTTSTLFQLFSTTKMFTGSTILALVEENHFTLDTRVRDLLPDLPETWADVTVYHLLTHTSGLPDLCPDPMIGSLVSYERDEAMRIVYGMPIQAKPGDQWSYNQTNYVLLGFIVEKCTGLTFPQYLSQRFFKPLGMTSSTFGDASVHVAGRSEHYARSENKEIQVRPYQFPAFAYTGAGLNTTVQDLARWDAGLFKGHILKDTTLESMFTPVKLNDGSVYHIEGTDYAYGCGWFVKDRGGHPYIGHSGGMCTAYIHFRDQGLGVVILANLFKANPEMLAEGVAELYLP